MDEPAEEEIWRAPRRILLPLRQVDRPFVLPARSMPREEHRPILGVARDVDVGEQICSHRRGTGPGGRRRQAADRQALVPRCRVPAARPASGRPSIHARSTAADPPDVRWSTHRSRWSEARAPRRFRLDFAYEHMFPRGSDARSKTRVGRLKPQADVAELADAMRSGRIAPKGRGGSSPLIRMVVAASR